MSLKDNKIFKVFCEMEKRGISYCHFKSNVNLDISFLGNTDFDILVAKENISEIKRLLFEFGFKQRYTSFDKTYVLMEDFLYYDEDIDKIHHFHLHYDLFFGKKLNKNIFLNIDFKNYIIKDEKYEIYVLKPEMELVLLILRLIFKGETSNFRYLLSNRKLKFEQSVLRELDYLILNINYDVFSDLLKNIFYDIQVNLTNFIKLYKSNSLTYPITLFLQYKVKRNNVKSLFFIEGDKYDCLFDIKEHAKECSVSWIQSGGKSIAIVGMDGSGKSTTVKKLHKFLSYKLSVENLYLGKVENFMTKRLKSFARKFRIVGFSYLEKILRGYQHIYMVNKKLEIFNKSKSNSKLGIITLFDRYPLREFYSMPDPMDGPKLTTTDLNFFINKEKNIFLNIEQYPDILIVLDIDLEISISRKPEHAKIIPRLTEKHKAIKNLINVVENMENVLIVDGSLDEDIVMRTIKKFVWNRF